MAASLSVKEVRDCAVQLQEDFLRAHAGNPDMDPRDINKVQEVIGYVEKFVRHNRGDHNRALNHMVEALTWRKSFGINDIKFEDIDQSLWKSGMAMNHGFDVTGQNVVILNIAKHRKDAKKAPMLRKWIAFSYETHQKLYPNNRMCMVFDMAGTGLSNMDMELVRFIVNCFKIYFPDMLEWLLVYNMPWILQAAWKIVQSWLTEGAAAKVKFVTSENIQEYIPAHNLLTKFGGTDTWEYEYEVEREAMLKLLNQFRETGRVGDGSREEEEEEEEVMVSDDFARNGLGEAGWSQDEAADGSTKQVRFSPSIPPSRQSRYGPDDDESFVSIGGPDQSLLKTGSMSSVRRRQVSRLMSLQETPREMESIGAQRNGSVPNLESTMETVSVGDVLLSPPSELIFNGRSNSDVFCTLTLKNTSDLSTAYKIKTTAPLRYKVRPNLAMIEPHSIARVQVMLIKGSEVKALQDKFLVQTHTFPERMAVPKPVDLPIYWKALPLSVIDEHRMRCRWVPEISSRPVIRGSSSRFREEKLLAQTPPTSPATTTTTTTTKTSSKPVATRSDLEEKVQKLMVSNIELWNSMQNLRRLNYVVVSVLVLLLLSIIFF